MSVETIQIFIASYPIIFIPLAIIIAYLLYRLTKFVLARGSFWIALRTETIYDDLMGIMGQPVHDSVGHHRVWKDGSPVFYSSVACEDN